MTNDTTHNTLTRAETIDRLNERIGDIRVCMFLTIDTDGRPRARPMYTQEGRFDGTLWFFTAQSSDKAAHLERQPFVSLLYASPSDESYLVINGTAELVDDRALIRERWSPMLKAWFDGPDDPDLRLVRVRAEDAELWDTPGGKLVSLFGLVKGAVTGSGAPQGDYARITL